MDNFEWSAAYNYRFGITKTAFGTPDMELSWKQSAYFYRDFIRRARGNA